MVIGYAVIAGVSWLRVPITGTLGMHTAEVVFVWEVLWRLSFAVAMGWIVWQWWRMLGETDDLLDVHDLVAGSAVVHVAAAFALPLTSSDLFSNMAYGRLGRAGLDPYRVGPEALSSGDPFLELVSLPWRGVPSVYGPILDGVNRLAAPTHSVALSILLHKLLFLAVALAVVVLAARIAGRFLPSGGGRAFVLVALNPVMVWEVSGQAHNDGLLALALLVGVGLLLSGRTWGALTALALGTLTKVATLPILGLLLCLELRRRPMRGAVMCVATAAVGALMANTGVDPYRITNSLAWFVHTGAGWVSPDYQTAAFRVWSLAVGTVLLLLGVRAALRTRTPDDLLREGLGYTLVLLMLALQFQPWYILWVLPLALLARSREVDGFVALLSILFVCQYPVTNRLVGSLSMLVVVWIYARTPGLPGIPRRARPTA